MDKKEKFFLRTLTSISLVLLLFTFVSSVALASTVQSTQLTINEIQITTNGSSQNIPDIYEDRIVWADYRNGNLDIYMYDLSNFTESQITTDESNQYYPEIYGDKIAWLDTRDGYNIYMYDLSTCTETYISSASSDGYPAIYGDRVVWKDDTLNGSNVYMYNVSTSKKIQITNSGLASSPAIYGDRIVWADMRSGDYNIYMYDLSTSRETRITTSRSEQVKPAIYSDKIVWKDEGDKPNLYMYDLSTSQETQITTTGSLPQFPGSGKCLAIYGNRIVWQDERNGDTNWYGDKNWDIYMYDLSTSTEIQITTNESNQVSPAIYRDKIVWTDNRNGNADIYMGSLSSHLPIASFCAFSASGNEPLKINFTDESIGSPTSWKWSFGDRTSSTERNPVHTYSTAGKYTVSLTVDNENGTDSKVQGINVQELKVSPVANFGANVTSGNIPLYVLFTDLSQNAISRVWDFNNDGVADSRDKTPVYVYTAPGIYTVNLTVSNANGTISKLSTITVSSQRISGQLLLTETQIISDKSHQVWPAIYADRIAWTDYRNGNLDIYVYDLSTREEKRITANGSWHGYSAIYGDRIVWQDWRNGNSDIYMYDLSTSNETQITINESNQYYPAIYGDKIVWQDDRNGDGYNIDIYMYNLSASKEVRITTNKSNKASPAIYGDKIVWADTRNGNSDIYMYDLTNSKEKQITTSESDQEGPSIYGDRIVWMDGSYPNYNIYMYNLSTSIETQITTSGSASSPKIYNDIIVYYRNWNSNLYMYNLSTCIETEIAASESYYLALYENMVVWQDNRNGNWDIYMCTVSEKGQEQIPLIPVANFSTNVTSGYCPLSVQFTDLSENAMSREWDFNNDGVADSSYANPVYVYKAPGIYTVNLTVSNTNATISKLSTIEVSSARRISGQLILTETQITTNVSDQWHPDIYEDRIVWEDYRNGWENSDIYMCNVSTGKEIPITTNEVGQCYPDIYGDIIVWEDMRNGNTDIYMYNLSTCKETQLTSDELNQHYPAIYGDRVVWQESTNNNYSIYMYNLSTSKETQITTNENILMLPAIYEDRVVWQDFRNGNFDIYLYNVSSSEETQITTSKSDQYKSNQYYPAIYGNLVAWENMSNMGVYVYNLSTSEEIQIVSDGLNNIFPAIYGDRIVWDDWRSLDGINTNIYMYNLSTSEETQITTDESSQTHPAIYGNRIVWQDYRNGNYDIYMCTVKNVSEEKGSTDGKTNGSNKGGSSGGSSGAGGSPEPAKNVAVKELSQAFITNGNPVKFDFTKNATCVLYVSFDSKRTVGKTVTIVEMLKNKSTLTQDAPEGEVYNYLNIWVGNSGFATSKNIENATVCFKVEKTWIQNKDIDRSSVTLNRYSDEKWDQLATTLLREDNKYLYFIAQTPGFSPFAITGKTIAKESGAKVQPSTEDIGENAESANTESEEADIEHKSEKEESKGMPGFEMKYGIIGFLGVFLYRRR